MHAQVQVSTSQYHLGYDSLCPIGWDNFTEATASWGAEGGAEGGETTPHDQHPDYDYEEDVDDDPATEEYMHMHSNTYTLTEEYMSTVSLIGEMGTAGG